MSKEEFYDTEIAPKLLELAKLCKEKEIPFFARVEYNSEAGEGATTAFTTKDDSLGQKMLNWVGQAKNNFDLFMMAVLREVKGKPHNSIYLTILQKELEQ